MSEGKEQTTGGSPRAQVLAALAQLVELPLTAMRRAADMRTLSFGKLRAVPGGSVGKFALHIQCPWRIESPAGIVTGRTDLWEPVETGEEVDYENWDYETSPNVQDVKVEEWLTEYRRFLIVRRIEADDYGGAEIHFEKDLPCGCFLPAFRARIGGSSNRATKRPMSRIS